MQTKQVTLSDDQCKALIYLIDQEIENNNADDNGAYNPFWDYIKEALQTQSREND